MTCLTVQVTRTQITLLDRIKLLYLVKNNLHLKLARTVPGACPYTGSTADYAFFFLTFIAWMLTTGSCLCPTSISCLLCLGNEEMPLPLNNDYVSKVASLPCSQYSRLIKLNLINTPRWRSSRAADVVCSVLQLSHVFIFILFSFFCFLVIILFIYFIIRVYYIEDESFPSKMTDEIDCQVSGGWSDKRKLRYF